MANEDKYALRKGYALCNGKYIIEKHLSSGGFGKTYKAIVKTGLYKYVAIKEFFMEEICIRDSHNTVIVPVDGNVSLFDSQKRKFIKEAERIRGLSCRYIVRVHDIFLENGTAYYAMDFIEGESLAQLMKRIGRPLSEEELLVFMPQIFDALEIVHGAGLLHLDIKPHNFMLGADGCVRLIDFGASKQDPAAGGKKSSLVAYTERYAPLEQMEQNVEKFGPWTDFYALGATMLNLLTNSLPPKPSDIQDDPTPDKNITIQLPTTVSSGTRRLIQWMMEQNRAHRPQNVSEIRHFMTQNVQMPSKENDQGVSSCNTKTVEWYRKVAEQGDADAQNHLGDCYYNGDGVSQDYAKAVEWYRKGAEQGNAEAQLNLGDCYYNGDGVPQDYSKAVEWYRIAAEQGDAAAQFSLGFCYFNGEGVSKDMSKAVEWYHKAAEQGDADAQNHLGDCYYYGDGVSQGYTKAVEWYRKAADLGYDVAQCNLGYCYESGEGVSKDLAKAVEWYRKAADLGYDVAQCNLGYCYESGEGVSKDLAKAVELYRMAAEQGYARAQCNLGYCYESGEGVSKDLAKAVEWYRMAAEQGYATAQYNLGNSYYNGEGVPRDYAKAVEWFRKAAEQGDADAQFNLGCCYYNGYGVSKDMSKAVEWYRKAAEQDNIDAQNHLGWMYGMGYGVPKDLQKAKMWYKKAADLGDESAKDNLEKIANTYQTNTSSSKPATATGLGYYFFTTEGRAKVLKWAGIVIGILVALLFVVNAISEAVENNEKKNSSETDNMDRNAIIQNLIANMVYVEGGTFMMGATSEQGDDAMDSEKPAHQVTVSSFSIDKYEVTQEEWEAVMGWNPSRFKGKPDSNRLPVECVSWDDCQTFIKKLNQLTGKNFRLPTEAEWEFAARGGNRSNRYKYSGSNDVSYVAWYVTYGNQIHPVGQKSPNELGLYDMSGNVCEWCSDWYGDYSSSAQTNPKGPIDDEFHVSRGGGWHTFASSCRVSSRLISTPDYRGDDFGLRLAL